MSHAKPRLSPWSRLLLVERVLATFDHGGATEVDLLERPYDSGSWHDGRLDLRPFQIITLRFGR